jgi:hypothetical protein
MEALTSKRVVYRDACYWHLRIHFVACSPSHLRYPLVVRGAAKHSPMAEILENLAALGQTRRAEDRYLL